MASFCVGIVFVYFQSLVISLESTIEIAGLFPGITQPGPPHGRLGIMVHSCSQSYVCIVELALADINLTHEEIDIIDKRPVRKLSGIGLEIGQSPIIIAQVVIGHSHALDDAHVTVFF